VNARVALFELGRAQAFGRNPACSPLWLQAPWGLRQRYADGRIDAEEFWRALRQWLEFEGRRAA